MARASRAQGTMRSSKAKYGSKRVFLDIPYKGSYKRYESAIRATLVSYELHPVLAKDSKQTKFILDEVCDLIRSAKYAVVDISGLNFNVAFEAGFLYALGGRTFILLKKKNTKPPADLQGLKYSEYTDKTSLMKVLRVWIKQNVPEAKPSVHNKDLRKIINKITRGGNIDRTLAKEMLLSMMEGLVESDGKLPLE